MFKTLSMGVFALATATAFAQSPKPLTCPVMGGTVPAGAPYTDYKGVRYAYCCPMCRATFEKRPAEVLAVARKRGGTFGVSLTDPVSGASLEAKNAVATSDYRGVRYLFASRANRAEFLKSPARYAAKSVGAGSVPASRKTDAGTEPAPTGTVLRSGKYQIELRIPDDGLYASEGVDVEFRISDTTQSDPIEGQKGVPNANPVAAVTMPSMEGMPVVRPHIHSEGVPGDYGLDLYFPHGGDYRIALNFTPEGGKPVKAAFVVSVKDAGTHAAKPPYAVKLIDPPTTAGTGKLRLKIEDTKTGETVTRFDMAHTKLFHLMIASKDLGWFVHEHPVQQPDGTFTIDQPFPAGGDYLVFADIAPKDKGSQVVSVPLHLAGPPPTWNSSLVLTKGPSRNGGIVADFVPMEKPVPVGKMTVLAFKLRDEATGKPVDDLQPYLGAHGHLMIVHQDGGTFVHSHPAEDAASERLLKTGEVRFNARFPRPGIYKAWAQFQRGGKVVTLPFVFEVKP
ncbi:hypothetical protein BH11ARM2_BH11ARM2_37700 [soil metagenome]